MLFDPPFEALPFCPTHSPVLGFIAYVLKSSLMLTPSTQPLIRTLILPLPWSSGPATSLFLSTPACLVLPPPSTPRLLQSWPAAFNPDHTKVTWISFKKKIQS